MNNTQTLTIRYLLARRIESPLLQLKYLVKREMRRQWKRNKTRCRNRELRIKVKAVGVTRPLDLATSRSRPQLDTVGVWGSNPHAPTNPFNNLTLRLSFFDTPHYAIRELTNCHHR